MSAPSASGPPSALGPSPQAPEDRHILCPPGQGPPRLSRCRGTVWTEEGAHSRHPLLPGPPSGRGRGHGETGPSRCEPCFSCSSTGCPVLSECPRPSTAHVSFGGCLPLLLPEIPGSDLQWSVSPFRATTPGPGSDPEHRRAGRSVSGAGDLLGKWPARDSPVKGSRKDLMLTAPVFGNTGKYTEQTKLPVKSPPTANQRPL